MTPCKIDEFRLGTTAQTDHVRVRSLGDDIECSAASPRRSLSTGDQSSTALGCHRSSVCNGDSLDCTGTTTTRPTSGRPLAIQTYIHTYTVAQKNGATGHPISLQRFRKLRHRIAWKLVDFCNIICRTQSLTFCLKISSRCGAA